MTNPKPHPSEAIERVEANLAAYPFGHSTDDAGNVMVRVRTADLRSLLSALGEAERRNVETSMNAYKWMCCHDELLGIIQNHPDAFSEMLALKNRTPCPSPQDVPAALSEATSWKARAERAEGALKPFADVCETEVYPSDTDSSKLAVRVMHLRLARSVLSPVGGGASIDSAVAESTATSERPADPDSPPPSGPETPLSDGKEGEL